jgi:hypothetical protein
VPGGKLPRSIWSPVITLDLSKTNDQPSFG